MGSSTTLMIGTLSKKRCLGLLPLFLPDVRFQGNIFSICQLPSSLREITGLDGSAAFILHGNILDQCVHYNII